MGARRWVWAVLVLALLSGGCRKSTPVPPNEALRRAAEQGNGAGVQRALARGANINGRDQSGDTPLHGAVLYGRTTVAEFLIACGADVNAANYSGETPLDNATRCGHVDVARMLLERGAGDDGTPDGRRKVLTSLLLRSHGGEIAELLVAYGADVKARGPQGATVLHYAAAYGSSELVGLLLRHGAEVNARDDAGQTPVVLALDFAALGMPLYMEPYKRETVQALIQAGAETASIHLAAFAGDRAKVEAFLRAGVDPNQPLHDGRTPLHIAAREGHANVIEALVACHASLDARDWIERTPLLMAAQGGHLEAVSALVASGADVSAKDAEGRTPLDYVDGPEDATLRRLLTPGNNDPNPPERGNDAES